MYGAKTTTLHEPVVLLVRTNGLTKHTAFQGLTGRLEEVPKNPENQRGARCADDRLV